MSSKYSPCPCTSGKLYSKCCGPFHSGIELPPTALDLMRSRFAAFALGLTDYLVKTTHKDNPERKAEAADTEGSWKKDLESIASQARFDSLKILEFVDGDSRSEVTFRAFITKGEEDLSFTERSLFTREDRVWLYKEGSILN